MASATSPYLKLMGKGDFYDWEPLEMRQLERMLVKASPASRNLCVEGRRMARPCHLRSSGACFLGPCSRCWDGVPGSAHRCSTARVVTSISIVAPQFSWRLSCARSQAMKRGLIWWLRRRLAAAALGCGRHSW